MAPPARPRARTSRCSRYTGPDWENQRTRIKELYLDKDKSLEETMRQMADKHNFKPTVKMYKDKFKEWGWCKNLSAEMARWMLTKADSRKRQDRKETEFVLGGRVWTLDRIRKSAGRRLLLVWGSPPNILLSDNFIDPHTPFGVTYKTPGTAIDNPSLSKVVSPGASRSQARRWTPAPDPLLPQLQSLALTWNGHTRADIAALYREAQELDRNGNFEDAEQTYLKALAGLEKLLSPTHEDTKAIAYELAAFYACHGRMENSNRVLDWMSERHIERWGFSHQHTAEHILHIVDLLNSWSRPEDALSFLHHAKDTLERLHTSDHPRDASSSGHQTNTDRSFASLATVSRQAQSPHIPTAVDDTDEPSLINNHLKVAKVHVKAKDEMVEPLLIGLIRQCEKHPERLAVQSVRARCELIELYRIMGREGDLLPALAEARDSFCIIWDSDTEKSKELMEASVELAKLHIKAGRCDDAGPMLGKVEEEAVTSFGPDDNRTIWILIRIGVMYQDIRRWDEAELRFEQALAASMTANGLEDGLTKTLEEALEKRHYSFLSSESGAFKSILGTSGLFIRPGSFFLGR
ncbi:hypothetical protein K469DRAFT_551926 [Zopfia rhizophila CBS 207.26]|uniref:Clr5 domain-containing protein n=1 Tax=Zopfia rhizophila CBS 207.26 TaxID=1314779 RepID=A0A6A6ER48_9PEZI|nr:hypothetical protein K469DRAFT_551926 [Zopfia rhizophila CBS 207.26]